MPGPRTSSDDQQADAVSPNVVAGKAPIKGASLNTAYYMTLITGKINNINTAVNINNSINNLSITKVNNINISRIQTNTILKTTAVAGARQSARQEKAALLSQSGGLAIGAVQGALAGQDDMGSQVAGSTISAGMAVYTGVKTAQAVSPAVINTVSRVRTAAVNVVQGIQTGVTKTADAIKGSYILVRGMVNGTVMKSVVAHNVLRGIGTVSKKATVQGLKITGRAAAGMAKGSARVLRRAIPDVAAGIGGTLKSSDDMMLKGIGHGMTATRYGIKTTVTAGRAAGRVIKTSVKSGVKTVKGTRRALQFVRQKGLRAAWARARNKAGTAMVNAGKSLVSAMVNLVKALGSKVVVPLVLMVAVIAVIMSVFSAPVVAIGGIFSGLFDSDNGDGTYTEVDIRAYITDPADGIPAKRSAYINDLYDYIQSNLEQNGGAYDYVRFKTNTQDNIIEPTVAGITGVFYTEEDLANIIQPIFNGIILKEYELTVTMAQAKQHLTEIFDKLFRRTESEVVEYCGQSAEDGSGTPLVHECGIIHAASDCPNPVTGIHTTYTCINCCYYYCKGHQGGLTCGQNAHNHSTACYSLVNGVYVPTCGQGEHQHAAWQSAANRGCYSTSYCSGCIFACHGYLDCGGHDVLTVTLNMDGLYQLLYEYFESPIEALASIPARTEAQESELRNLKDYYEICLEYIGQVSQVYGGGLTMEDLTGVTWVNGSRAGNQAIIDLALSQVGQVGGQPYWSWYGYSTRVEWCACFVSWCMNKTGHSEVKYSSCQYGGVPYFQGQGRWANGGFSDLAAGDVIFFDWELDGQANHTGLVIGTDGTYVYTVEGNSGDACRMKKYELGSSVVMGYGLMNY